MKRALGFVLAFLPVLVLLAPGAAEAQTQPAIEVAPKRLVISGIIGVSPFQHPFTVRAPTDDVTGLTFRASNLNETTGGNSWVIASNVQVSPVADAVRKGQSQDFILTVQGIPASGEYEGTVTVSYRSQAGEGQETVSISVRAARLSPVPPLTLLKLEKNFAGLGGTRGVPWTLVLNEETGRMPQEMTAALARTATITLIPLINGDDKSQIIRPEQIMARPMTLEALPGGQGLVARAVFTNPQVNAGKYTGNLLVRSEAFGTIATVPVEVQVRYSGWLAWVIIALGVAASSGVTWWNTAGRKKNTVRTRMWRLRDKLRSAGVTPTCRNDIAGLLDKAAESLDDDRLDEAQESVKAAEARFDKGKEERRALREVASEVKGLLDDLDKKVVQPIQSLAGPDAPIIKVYLNGIRTEIETLRSNLERDAYPDASEALKQAVARLKGRLYAFAAPAPEVGLLDSLARLEEWLSRFDEPYRDGLRSRFVDGIKASLAGVRSEQDLADVPREVKAAAEQFGRARGIAQRLRVSTRQIEQEEQAGRDMTGAREALDKCRRYLAAANIDMAEKQSADIDKAIEEGGRVPTAPGLPTRPAGETFKSPHVDFDLLSYVESPPAPPAPPPTATQEALGRLRQWWDSFLGWWTPPRQERAVKAMLYLVAMLLLAVLGYSQLYANNSTFGARNIWEEYLGLFLWGFGIQTGTATLAGVRSAFAGS